MAILNDFIRMSHYAGQRFDLSQANGGNSSVKIGDYIFIKSTGYYLSDIGEKTGFTKLKLKPLRKLFQHVDIVNIQQIKNSIKNNLVNGNAPSIEIGMHALLGTFVLHTHPLSVNALTCHQQWKLILHQLFPQAILVDYATPGHDLAVKILEQLKATKADTQKTLVMFLQNHGLVVSAASADIAVNITRQVVEKIERRLHLNLKKYKVTEKICALIRKASPNYSFCHCCNNQELQHILLTKKKLFFQNYCLPIAYMYNTMALELANLEDAAPLHAYIKHYHRTPQVIIYRKNIYLLAANIQKALELESVVHEHLYMHQITKNKIRLLTKQEIKLIDKAISS